MQQRLSLREWARNNKIWEPYSWRTFLEKDLVPFYRQAFILNEFYNFLKSYEICGKNSLKDIEDEVLKNKVRVAIYGGADNPATSFAKFMYDYFGLRAENASSFEESIKFYESWGDSIKISVRDNSWINSISIKNLVDELRRIISEICSKIGIRLSEVGIQETYPYYPSGFINPDTLLPQPGEKPEKLISLINEFRQKAVDLSIGVNPFTTFVFYIRAIPLLSLMKFLECDIDKITKLANFLGLRAYSMIDFQQVSLPTKSPDKFILVYDRASYNLTNRLLVLQYYLMKIDQAVEEVYSNFIKEAINQIHVNFEPWKGYYEPIFSILNKILIEDLRYSYLTSTRCSFYVENGRIVKIKNEELSNKVDVKEFLIKISPVISSGIINDLYFRGSSFELDLHSITKEWINKVIANEGKT
jgi:hypothetical protein